MVLGGSGLTDAEVLLHRLAVAEDRAMARAVEAKRRADLLHVQARQQQESVERLATLSRIERDRASRFLRVHERLRAFNPSESTALVVA